MERGGTGWRIYESSFGFIDNSAAPLPTGFPPDTLTPMQKWLPRQLMC